jgi:hypothetical protein
VKFTGRDLRPLGLPIAACVFLVLAGAASYLYADDYLKQSKAARDRAATQRRDVQTKLARATDEEREIRANLQQYKALAEAGLIGEEQRLDWIDTITAIKNERQLFSIRYELDAQKALDYPGFSGGGVDFMVSRMKIEMQLLHEEDLLHFIDEFGRRGKAHLSVRSCSMARLDRAPVPGTSLAPRLRANCAFDLITIRNKPA